MDDLDVNAAMDGITKAGDMEREQTARENFNAFSSGLKSPNPPTNPQEVAAAHSHPDTGAALRIDHWVQHLPRNVSVGLLDAAVNTGDAIRDFYHSPAANLAGQPQYIDAPPPAEGQAAKPKMKPGMQIAGNLDPWNRPVLRNSDGTISTTRSFSIGTDQGETLIPQIVNGKLLSKDAAIAHFKETGQHLGVFDTPENADRYATALHNEQARVINHMEGDTAYNYAKGAVMTFRDRLANGLENPEDALTQQVSQLAIPGLGLAKLAGATASLGLANTARVALADAVVAGTVLEPHSGRLADLAELGKHTEGKLGAVFNTLAPDGSLMNHYLNWMTDRVGESDFSGRIKNMIDSLSGSAALSGVINTALGSVRYAKYIAENAGAGPVGLKAQLGHLSFHGTPHMFDEFDASKIGTGEGAQSYGHGLYFAENKNTAQTYQQRLSGKGSVTLSYAKEVVAENKGDKAKAIIQLNKQMADEPSADIRDTYKRVIDHIKAGSTDRGSGMLAHVHIPDEVVGKMLNHDEGLWDQEHIMNAIPKADQEKILAARDINSSEDFDHFDSIGDLTGQQFRQAVELALEDGSLSYRGAGKGNAAADAAHYLNAHGIPGITYLDAGSRSTGTGTRNIVLFDPQHAKIIKKE